MKKNETNKTSPLKKFLIFSSLFTCLATTLNTVSFAETTQVETNQTCREEVLMKYTNLQKAKFRGKLYLTVKTEALLNNAKDDAYQLSMPLLVSAQLGNKALYQKALIRMNKAMDAMEDSPFKAWIYGRILLAAQGIKDEKTVSKTLTGLTNLLDGFIKNDGTGLDRFTVWSLGYLAALDMTEFMRAKDNLLAGANALTDAYFTINAKEDATEDQKQEKRSDALWAWVMISQAAANAHQRESFDYAIEQMLRITKELSIGEALTKGLLRTAASNDYPAWASSLVSLAAETLPDRSVYDALQDPLQASIQAAKKGNHLPEMLLAIVNKQLAIERDNRIQQQCAATLRP